MIINKDTLMFGSFSSNAGSVGCKIFNTCFQYDNINAIYKSFSVSNIEDAIKSSLCLNFSGFAVSMPYKTEIIKYLDVIDELVKKTKSCNTVVIKNSKLYGYNTDYMAVNKFLKSLQIEKLYILGNGSYSGTVQKSCQDLNIEYKVITRDNWEDIKLIKNSNIFNCTPVIEIDIDKSNLFIDCINTTDTGRKLAMYQASIQYELYTNKKFPLSID